MKRTFTLTEYLQRDGFYGESLVTRTYDVVHDPIDDTFRQTYASIPGWTIVWSRYELEREAAYLQALLDGKESDEFTSIDK